MQSVVSGRASRRFTWISSPHSSQMPKVPSSILRSAFSILSRKLFSRPRRRNVNDCRYSLEARSISSGRSSVSSVMSCSSVCLAFLRISSRLSVRSVLNFLRVALFTRSLLDFGGSGSLGERPSSRVLQAKGRAPAPGGAGYVKHRDGARQSPGRPDHPNWDRRERSWPAPWPAGCYRRRCPELWLWLWPRLRRGPAAEGAEY